MPRTLTAPRAPGPAGKATTSSSSRTRPVASVPVATVPNPLTVNTRSSGRRSGPSIGRGRAAAASRPSSACSAGSPAPVAAEQGTIAADSRKVPRTRPRTSSVTSASQSGAARSVLVSAISPRGTPSSRHTSRCSRVCGIGPSSAATTSMTRSIPLAPATMVRTNRSCPGTSIIASVSPDGSASGAKPSSMVMPRAFSSGSRSVSTPVSARTSAVLP